MQQNPSPAPIAVAPEAAAEMIDLGRSKIFELLRSGALPSFTVGKRRLIRVADLQAFVDRLAKGETERAA